MNPSPLARQGLREALDTASRDLVAGSPGRLSVDQARLLHLQAWCYYTSARDSEHRAAHATRFVDAWRLQRARADALAPVFQAWHALGVRAAAFKGLAMAWLAYPHEALRFAGDADLVIDPRQAALARQVAVDGWTVVPCLAPEDDLAFYLFHAQLGFLVEVHTSLVPDQCMGRRFSARLTQRMLAAARPMSAWGVGGAAGQCISLQPTDLALALALNRAWKSDAWCHKPHDYLDLKFLAERQALTQDDIAGRAAALGVLRTWSLFLRHCNPWAARFDMSASRRRIGARWLLDWSVWHGGLPPRVRPFIVRTLRRIPALARVLWTAPVLLGVLMDLRSQPSPADASARRTGWPRLGPAWPLWQVEQAARRCVDLFGALRRWPGAGPCVVQSLTLYRLLRQHGHGARWCLGYRRSDDGGATAHAWVECDDPYALGIKTAVMNRRYQRVYSRSDADPAPTPSLAR